MSRADLTYKISADGTSFAKNIKKAESELERFSRRARQHTTRLTQGFAVAATAAAAVSAVLVTKAVRAAADFEQSVANAAAKTNDFAGSTEAFRKAAIEAGNASAYSAKEAADALDFLAMAGFSAQAATTALPGVLRLAAAGGLDLARSADIASNVLTGFRMEASQLDAVGDVLVKAFTSANVSMEQLGESFKYAGPVASAAGLAFEETAGLIAFMGNAGIQGSQSGTALRGALSRLLKPSSDVSATLRQLGVNVQNSDGSMRSMVDILRDLERAGMSTEQAIRIFGQEAGPGMLAVLAQGTDALEAYVEGLRNAEGAAAEMEQRQLDTLSGKLKILTGLIDTAAIQLGEAFVPVLREAADEGIKLATALGDSDELLRKVREATFDTVDALADLVSAASKAAGFVLVLGGAFRDLVRIVETIPFFAAGAAYGLLTIVDTITFGLIPGLDQAREALQDSLRWLADDIAKLGDSTDTALEGALKLNDGAETLAAKIRAVGDRARETTRELDAMAARAASFNAQELTGRSSTGPGLSAETIALLMSVDPDAAAAEDAVRRGAEAAAKHRQAQRQANDDLLREGQRVFDSTRTAAERYQAELARLDDLLRAGAISADTHGRAVDALEDSYTGASQRLAEMERAAARVRESLLTDADRLRSGLLELDELLLMGQIQRPAYDQAVAQLKERYDEGTRKAKEYREELQKFGESVTAEVRTPVQRYNDDLRRLQEALAAGAISHETYERAATRAWNELRDSARQNLSEVERFAQGTASAVLDSFEEFLIDPFEASLEGLLDSFTRTLAQMASEVAKRQILAALFEGGASAASGALPLPGFSTGGPVHGPGTATSDSIVARLSDGEFVVRAAAVESVGVAHLEELNRTGQLPRFAEGGLVGNAAGGAGLSVRVVNVISLDLIYEAMESSAGERIIVNTIGKNAGTVRRFVA